MENNTGDQLRRFFSWVIHPTVNQAIAYLVLIIIGLVGLGTFIFDHDNGERKMVVTATENIPPYTIIESKHISVTELLSPPDDSVTDPTGIVGYVATAPLSKGIPIRSKDIRRLDPNSAILTVLRPVSDTLSYNSGTTIWLVGVSEDTEQLEPEELSKQAVVLGTSADRLVLVLPQDKAKRAAWFMTPNRRLIILRPDP